jgi:hypothetical protein
MERGTAIKLNQLLKVSKGVRRNRSKYEEQSKASKED